MNSLHINAKSGDPNTFWQGESGRWYRTKDDATEDDMAKSVNPDDYRIDKSFYYRNHRIFLGLWAIIAATMALWIIYKLNKNC